MLVIHLSSLTTTIVVSVHWTENKLLGIQEMLEHALQLC